MRAEVTSQDRNEASVPMADPEFHHRGPDSPAAPDCNADPQVVATLKRLADASAQPMLIFDGEGRFRYFNRAFRWLGRVCAREEAARVHALSDLVPELVPAAAIALAEAKGEWSGEVFIARPERRPVVLQLQILRLGDAPGIGADFGATFRDTSEEYARGRELQSRNTELEAANAKIRGTQEQLIQTEKLASIGQLAAGVAHEINNPMGYVHSNLETLVTYSQHLLALVEAYDHELHKAAREESLAEIREMRRRFDFEFLRTDLPQLLAESREGAERVRKIIQDLKDFSRSDASNAWVTVDLHRGLDSTLNIVWNELKYKARIVKNYDELPPVRCIPSELNQVFLNVLVNAGQAIEHNGIITISTMVEGDYVVVAIGDDGVGIPEAMLPRIFDPFFTTKPVGKGTGLGLSISYGIIKKHGGSIEVSSASGQGTLFRILLPIRPPASGA
ncbi:MAG TPA: ATP-binding protein [Rudaea sp.]